MYIRVKRHKRTIFLQVEPTDTVLEVKHKLQDLCEQVRFLYAYVVILSMFLFFFVLASMVARLPLSTETVFQHVQFPANSTALLLYSCAHFTLTRKYFSLL